MHLPVTRDANRELEPNKPERKLDATAWARRCRIEAVRAIHPSTKAFLLELAAELEAVSGEVVNVDPDDTELQNAVADRLAAVAATRRN